MINLYEVTETNNMISKENLDVRTITLGVSLLDCIDSDLDKLKDKIYRKIYDAAKDLVRTGEEISREFGVPIVNKRISVTPMALVGGAACRCAEDFAALAGTLDRVAKDVGVNFIGGYSALVCKGMTSADELLIRSIPLALSSTERVCSSVNLGSTRTGINMDAVRLMGEIIKNTAEYTKENDSLGCAKLVVFCNAPDDNPFMAGAFHGVTEADKIINVGVSGPGVVKNALEKVRGESFEVLCETIKKTAFKVTRVGQLVAQEASARLGVPFGIVDLSLAPTPAIGDSVADILCEIGLEHAGAPGTTAALALLNDQVKKGGVMASSQRRVHSRQRGSGDDRCGAGGSPDLGKAGGHDLRLLRGAGYDRHSGGYQGIYHIRHHCRRDGHRHGEPEDHCRPHYSRDRKGCGGDRRVRRPAGLCAYHAGKRVFLRGFHRPQRKDPCTDS